MTPEQVLAIKPKVLTQAQRESYFNDGFLLVERAISQDWIAKLRAATDELVERSRKVTKSDPVFDLEPKHRPDAPRLRRVSNPVEQHPVFWEYCLNSVMADIVADLVGPDVEVPPLQAQLQVGERRRGGEVALRHQLLPAHQLFAADGRHLPV